MVKRENKRKAINKQKPFIIVLQGQSQRYQIMAAKNQLQNIKQQIERKIPGN